MQGVPGLGDIPLMRYLFSQENKEVNDQEVLVMLTPRVIRLPEPAMAQGSPSPWVPSGVREGAPGAVEGARAYPSKFHTPEPRQPQ